MKDKTKFARPIFKFLTGDINYHEHGGSFISQKYTNNNSHGPFEFYLVAEWYNPSEGCHPFDFLGCPKYGLLLSVVAPSLCPQEELLSAARSMDVQDILKVDPITQVEVLASNGIKHNLWDDIGDNYQKLWREMVNFWKENGDSLTKELAKPANILGSTGWDMLKGDPGAGMFSVKGDTTCKNIIRKMHGLWPIEPTQEEANIGRDIYNAAKEKKFKGQE